MSKIIVELSASGQVQGYLKTVNKKKQYCDSTPYWQEALVYNTTKDTEKDINYVTKITKGIVSGVVVQYD